MSTPTRPPPPSGVVDAPPGRTAPTSPYMGLTPYTEDDAAFFFGRERETEIITANALASRLTLLYGESGVGKSSVLRAGVMRKLRRMSERNLAERGKAKFLAVAFSEWRDDSVNDLVNAIGEAAKALYGDAVEPVPACDGLDETVEAWTNRVGGTLILVLDQFEEYFVYHPSDKGPGAFGDQLVGTLNRPDLRVSVLIGIREDALAKLDAFKGRIPNLFDNYLRLDHLSLKAARAAIEEPVGAYNDLLDDDEARITIEPELVDAVLTQVRRGRLALAPAGEGAVDGRGSAHGPEGEVETPFLQLVMSRLWDEEMAERSTELRLSTLERLGGAERIVRTHLDHAMDALPVEQQEVAAEVVFRWLVTPSGTKIAYPFEDLLASARELGQGRGEDLVGLLRHLSDPQVLIARAVTPSPGQAGGLRYEIFHDVLAPAIVDWRARWAHAKGERELAASLEHQARERALAEERAARERTRARMFRAVAAAAIVVAAIAAGLGVWAFRQKDAAQRQRSAARSGELALRSTTELATDPRLSVALAVAAMDERHTPEAQQALRMAVAESPVRMLLRGGGGRPLRTAGVSPDGRYVLTGGDDRTVRLWRTGDGREIPVRDGRIARVRSLAWSPDGSYFLAGDDGGVRLWRGAQAIPTHVPEELFAYVSSGGPHGEYIATAGYDVVRIRDTRTRRLNVVWQWPAQNLVSARLDRSGTRLVVTTSGATTHEARVFAWRRADSKRCTASAPRGRADRGCLILNAHGQQRDDLNAAAFSADGTKVVTGSGDQSVAVWDAHGGKLLSQVSLPSAVNAVAMSPNEGLVAAAAGDAVYLVDWRARTTIATFVGQADTVSDLSFGPGGHVLVSASDDGTVRLWAVPLLVLPHAAAVESAAWRPDGRAVVTTSGRTGRIWDASTGRLLTRLRGHSEALTGAVFSPDGRYVLTSAGDRTARIWSARTGAELTGKRLVSAAQIDSAAFDASGRRLVVTSGGRAQIWDWGRHIRQAVIPERGTLALQVATFSPDGRYLLATSGVGPARIWDWRSAGAAPVQRLGGRRANDVVEAAWSHDGRRVVTVSSGQTARVWDWRRAGRAPAVLTGTGLLQDAAFSPDDRFVVTTSTDGSVRIWDWRARKALPRLSWERTTVHSGAFSPDGRRVVTATEDGSADVFACDACGSLDRLLDVARARVRLTVAPAEHRALLRAP